MESESDAGINEEAKAFGMRQGKKEKQIRDALQSKTDLAGLAQTNLILHCVCLYTVRNVSESAKQEPCPSLLLPYRQLLFFLLDIIIALKAPFHVLCTM